MTCLSLLRHIQDFCSDPFICSSMLIFGYDFLVIRWLIMEVMLTVLLLEDLTSAFSYSILCLVDCTTTLRNDRIILV